MSTAKANRRKLKERMLPDEEVLTPEELKAQKRKKMIAIRMQDEKLKEEEEKMWSRGICPRCRVIMTTTGQCSMGCS